MKILSLFISICLIGFSSYAKDIRSSQSSAVIRVLTYGDKTPTHIRFEFCATKDTPSGSCERIGQQSVYSIRDLRKQRRLSKVYALAHQLVDSSLQIVIVGGAMFAGGLASGVIVGGYYLAGAKVLAILVGGYASGALTAALLPDSFFRKDLPMPYLSEEVLQDKDVITNLDLRDYAKQLEEILDR